MTPGQEARQRVMLARLAYEVAAQDRRLEMRCGLGHHTAASRRATKRHEDAAAAAYQRALDAWEALP